jgi:CubicO group peptidase (beta-lactamase class C family)
MMLTRRLQHLGPTGHGGAFGTKGWIDPNDDLISIMLIQHAYEGGEHDQCVPRLAEFSVSEQAAVTFLQHATRDLTA